VPELDLHGTAITALLGPTNTGKTWTAIQRMLGHRTGMIGLPLRLLAREVYDQVVRARGPEVVALVTGEERIVPPGARYWVATVEAMPVELPVAFLAVDEIQLCTHPTRGHVFTDRLLHARGTMETMFLGADTMAPLVQRLLPTAAIERRPRLSTLRYAGPHKLTALPPRSAVVAFGTTRVYELAERLRRRHGGTAVVLGALSPRTRNRQVELYQQGDVPYLVATDAIGMGLNLDLSHVALSSLTKFDGRTVRELYSDEVAQIAGRAGRHHKDGTFGALDELGPLPPELVQSIEEHRFPPIPRIRWRNSDLDFRSPQALLDSLEAPPPLRVLVRTPDALDHATLELLARREPIRRAVRGPEATRLLWDVCQVPDYRNTLTDAHVELLARLHGWLSSPQGHVPADELHRALRHLDRTEGDIEALMTRLAWIRTWTYVAHRPTWLADPGAWQARTRAVEDRLSDALHDKLTQRFVDRRTRLASGLGPAAERGQPSLEEDGSVVVLGTRVGEVRGLSFVPDPQGLPADEPAFEREVRRLLQAPVARRLEALLAAPDADIVVGADGTLRWEDVAVGTLKGGSSPLAPVVRPLRLDLLEAAQRAQVGARLEAWRDALVDRVRGPLLRPPHAALQRPGRGIHFQLMEGLGSVAAAAVAELSRELGEEDRRNLARLGVRLGQHHAYVVDLLRPDAVAARARLWATARGEPLPPSLPGGASCPRVPGWRPAWLVAVGYTALGTRAVRQDLLEKVSAHWRKEGGRGRPFEPSPEPLEWLGCPKAEGPGLLRGLGYRPVDEEGRRWVAERPAPRAR